MSDTASCGSSRFPSPDLPFTPIGSEQVRAVHERRMEALEGATTVSPIRDVLFESGTVLRAGTVCEVNARTETHLGVSWRVSETTTRSAALRRELLAATPASDA